MSKLPPFGSAEWGWQEHSSGDWISPLTNLIAKSYPEGHAVTSLSVFEPKITWYSGMLGVNEAMRCAESIAVSRESEPEICPLPRIGSKEWGWTCQNVLNCARWSTVLCGYQLVETYACKVTKWNGYLHDTFGSDLSLRDAKTLAESRARRDWRRENGRKT